MHSPLKSGPSLLLPQWADRDQESSEEGGSGKETATIKRRGEQLGLGGNNKGMAGM